jgi:hypothetical protein
MRPELRNQLKMARQGDGGLHAERERDPLFHIPVVEYGVCRSGPVTWLEIDEPGEMRPVRKSAGASDGDNLDPILLPEMAAHEKRV